MVRLDVLLAATLAASMAKTITTEALQGPEAAFSTCWAHFAFFINQPALLQQYPFDLVVVRFVDVLHRQGLGGVHVSQNASGPRFRSCNPMADVLCGMQPLRNFVAVTTLASLFLPPCLASFRHKRFYHDVGSAN